MVRAHAVSGSDLTHLANEMRDVATDASTPDQRCAPMTPRHLQAPPGTPRARSSSEHDSHWHPVDHVHQFLAALGTTCRWEVLETGMRLKLQLLAPSQPETPITTVVDVGRTGPGWNNRTFSMLEHGRDGQTHAKIGGWKGRGLDEPRRA